MNQWESGNSNGEGSWNDIPLLQTHEELEAYLYGNSYTKDHHRISGCFEEEDTSMSLDNTMGINIDSRVLYDAKSKITDAMKKEKNVMGDTLSDFSSTKFAQNLPKKHAFTASISNADPEGGFPRATDLMLSMLLSNEVLVSKIFDAARAAMDELFLKATKGEPLWITNDDGTEKFNEKVYQMEFRLGDMTFENKSLGANVEVTREFGCVPMLREDIVNMLMNCDLWAANFCNIVSRATGVGVFLSGYENHDGTLLVIRAEFHAVSPFIPTRESYLARYCRQLDEYTWGVVDISIEHLLYDYPDIKFQRKPSGCLITEIHNRPSTNVAWVEHCIAIDVTTPQDLKPIVNAGIGFGARYWLSALSRYASWCNEAATINMLPNYGVNIEEGSLSILRLGERLLRSFYIDMSSLKYGMWIPSTLLDAKYIAVRRSKYNGVSGLPVGDTVTFGTSFKLPVSPRKLFDHLSREDSRAKWDILSFGCNTRTLIRIPTTPNSNQNYISILEVSDPGDYNAVHYLQNAYKDCAGGYVVYAPIDGPTINHLLSGGDPDIVMILPSGFYVLPDKVTPSSLESEGCLVNAGFHLMDATSPTQEEPSDVATETLEFAQRMVTKTVEVLMYFNPPGNH